uniref:DUF4259 domain-containing protein n=1 Tax=Herbidospora sakaeratensis TaxID=564415 RepID=UPI000A05AFE5|nr:DUF4259 domain-containing protein [Herbidospora sakaeratensis]
MGTWGASLFGSDSAQDFLDIVASMSESERLEHVIQIFEEADRSGDSSTAEVTPEEIIAAASIVAGSLPGGEFVLLSDDYEGLSDIAFSSVSPAVRDSALRALSSSIPPGGWWWNSWVDPEDRAQMEGAIERIRAVLNTGA